MSDICDVNRYLLFAGDRYYDAVAALLEAQPGVWES
jgi:hypothetical protein